MKLLIVRHGDPDYSIDSLTETGWIEAELLSDRLCKLDVKAFYCSPKGRARDTAKATLEKLGRQAEILPWLREFSPQVLRPGKDKPGVAWDWLPQDWTKDKGFYDREHWWENDRFTAAGVREEAQWVWDGLDELLARHGYRREGEYQRGYHCPVLPFWRYLRPAEPSAGDFPHAAVAGNLLSAHLRHHPEHGGAPGGHRVVPHDCFRGYVPSVCGGTGAILLRSVL